MQIRGHAIECRINAESPARGFRPSPGKITDWSPPQGPHIRLDTHCFSGYTVPMFYDSMIAKLIVSGRGRSEAVSTMLRALEQFKVEGVDTTIAFQRFVVGHQKFVEGKVNTRLIEDLIGGMSATGV